jgi:serine/threonine-protein kinase
LITVAEPPAPDRIGRYEVLLRIASGGMGTVYLARSLGVEGFERPFAIKLLHDPALAHDVIEEARVAVRLRHPNVVPLLEIGAEDPLGTYLVMEYVDGDSLSGLRRAGRAQNRPMPLPIGMRILVDALNGLHATHELCDEGGHPFNLVHRDFSPQDILVGTDGVTRLASFGIAQARSSLGRGQAGQVTGKIEYMSPEQVGGFPVDRRSDVWAAGIVAWELLAGQRLYRKDEPESALLHTIVTAEPPLLRSVAPGVALELELVVASALKMDPEQRTMTAAVLARDLAESRRGVQCAPAARRNGGGGGVRVGGVGSAAGPDPRADGGDRGPP